MISPVSKRGGRATCSESDVLRDICQKLCQFPSKASINLAVTRDEQPETAADTAMGAARPVPVTGRAQNEL